MKKLPTIGIEIELPWQAMLARVDEEAAVILRESDGFYALDAPQRQRVQQGFDLVDLQYKERVEGVFGEDVAERSDGFTEFAFNPKQHHEEIVDTARRLYEQDILRSNESYPLHVTLGGIAAQHSSWLILMAAELSGGVSPERIIQIGTWSQKGQAGIRQRGARELQLGQSVAIELRSLEVQDIEQLETTLAICLRAGGLLLSKLAGDPGAQSRWHELHRVLLYMTDHKGIDARTRWKNPHIDITPWQRLATALADSQWVADVRSTTQALLQTGV
jgi:hypothetical protein